MLKKTITYTDYDGNVRTEDFYFHINKAEAMELETSVSGGLTKLAQKLSSAPDGATIIKLCKELILKAYGEKSLDGKRFIKSPELSAAFEQTEAYSELFMELATDADAAAAFFNGIAPKDVNPMKQPPKLVQAN